MLESNMRCFEQKYEKDNKIIIIGGKNDEDERQSGIWTDVRIEGMTFYMRNGQVIGRESETHEKRSNTLPQFVQRQKMRHTTMLWKMLRFCDTMFTERRTAYQKKPHPQPLSER